MKAFLRALGTDNKAATAVEYGLIVALIVIAMVASFQELANTTTTMWNNVSTKVKSATGN